MNGAMACHFNCKQSWCQHGSNQCVSSVLPIIAINYRGFVDHDSAIFSWHLPRGSLTVRLIVFCIHLGCLRTDISGIDEASLFNFVFIIIHTHFIHASFLVFNL